jgi:NAD(P)-dependent dehydrogenase (short-subunit alcohol dehydrogenase family)
MASPQGIFAAGKNALITGGASGIGLAIARLCKKHGMKVVIADYSEENLKTAEEALGPDTTAYRIDVGRVEEWKKLKASVDEQFDGRIDLLMLNAGTSMKPDWGSKEYFHKVLYMWPCEVFLQPGSIN